MEGWIDEFFHAGLYEYIEHMDVILWFQDSVRMSCLIFLYVHNSPELRS